MAPDKGADLTSSQRSLRVTAWLVFLLTTAVLIATGLVQSNSLKGLTWAGTSGVLAFPQPFISCLIGAVIISRRGSHVVGWLFCLSGLTWALTLLAGSYAGYLPTGGALPLEQQVLWLGTWPSYLAFALVPAVVLFVFPDGRLAGPRWKPHFIATLGVVSLATIGTAFTPGPIEDSPAFTNPYGITGGLGEAMKVLRDIGWPLLLVAMGVAVWSLRARTREASLEERQQIKWILLGGMALAAFVLFWGVMQGLGHEEIPATIGPIALSIFPAAVGIAILRFRLYDIDLLINRTLVYGTLSAILGFVYLGAVVLLQRLSTPLTAESDIAIAASTLAVAALFRPLRAQVQRFIDHRFYRSRYDAAATLEEFSFHLRDQVDLESLSHQLVSVVSKTMQPAHVSLWLREEERPSRNDSVTMDA
jgi:hypothetical protein